MGENIRERVRDMPGATISNARIQGYVDVLRLNRVAGWTIDRTDPAISVTVEIWREGALIAEAIADRARPDLVSAGVGTGRYGFTQDIAPPLEPGFEFTINVVARLPDGTRAPLPRARGADEPAPVERRLLERIYEAMVDKRLPAGRETDAAAAAARLSAAIDRIEMTQLRLEAALDVLDRPKSRDRSLSVRMLVAGAVAIAAFALAAGVWSLLFEAAATGAP